MYKFLACFQILWSDGRKGLEDQVNHNMSVYSFIAQLPESPNSYLECEKHLYLLHSFHLVLRHSKKPNSYLTSIVLSVDSLSSYQSLIQCWVQKTLYKICKLASSYKFSRKRTQRMWISSRRNSILSESQILPITNIHRSMSSIAEWPEETVSTVIFHRRIYLRPLTTNRLQWKPYKLQ